MSKEIPAPSSILMDRILDMEPLIHKLVARSRANDNPNIPQHHNYGQSFNLVDSLSAKRFKNDLDSGASRPSSTVIQRGVKLEWIELQAS